MPQTNEKSIWLRLFAQIADVVMTVIAFVTAFAMRTQIRSAYFFGSAQSVESYYNVLIIAVVVWWFLLDFQKAYTESRRFRLMTDLNIVLRTVFIGTVLMFAIAYALRLEVPPRSTTVLFVIIGTGLLLLNRVFFSYVRLYLRQEGSLAKTILLVGAGEKAQRFLNSVRDHADWGIDLIGFVELDPAKVGREIMGAQVLGTPDDLPRILHEYPIQEVVFAVSTRQLEDCTDMLALCEQEGVNTVILSNFFSSLVAQVTTEILYDQPVLIYRTTRHKEWQLLVKRLFDIAFSAIVLLAADCR